MNAKQRRPPPWWRALRILALFAGGGVHPGTPAQLHILHKLSPLLIIPERCGRSTARSTFHWKDGGVTM